MVINVVVRWRWNIVGDRISMIPSCLLLWSFYLQFLLIYFENILCVYFTLMYSPTICILVNQQRANRVFYDHRNHLITHNTYRQLKKESQRTQQYSVYSSYHPIPKINGFEDENYRKFNKNIRNQFQSSVPEFFL